MPSHQVLMSSADLIYISSLSMCFLCLLVLYCFNLKSWKPFYWNSLSFCYLFTMLSVLSDIIWTPIDGKVAYIPLNYLINMVEFASFGFVGFSWFLYCSRNCPFPFWKKRIVKFFVALPAFIMAVLIVTTPLHGLVFYIDAEGRYCRGSLFILQQSGYFYLVLCSVIAAVSYFKTQLYKKKQFYKALAVFSFPIAFLGVVQLLLPVGAVPTLHFSLLISFMIVYSCEQELKITIDPLTKLVNRFEFERILNEKILRYRRGEIPAITVLVGDMNQFKSINDEYGHMEGDNALRITADQLQTVSYRHGAIVSHVSGDEFYFIMETGSKEKVVDYIHEVSAALSEASRKLPYRLSISMGAAAYDSTMTIPDILNKADERMYEYKNRKKLDIR